MMLATEEREQTCEFTGIRSKLYDDVLTQYPDARKEEVQININLFKPKEGEKILEIGSGSGLYTKVISDMLGKTGELVATDPSRDQLDYISKLNRDNIRIVEAGSDTLLSGTGLEEEKGSFDGMWSLGAFHHCMNKSESFKNFHELLKTNGRLFICDVFSGSFLADYFDSEVSRYSSTGHEVAFLTKGFASSLCSLYGFTKPKFHDMDFYWHFDTREDLGIFMYGIHGMVKTTLELCLEKVEELMYVDVINNKHVLRVPLTILETYKI